MLARIHIEFAAASPMAAILRRGPSKWVRLLAWNTHSDVIEAGSWFHGRIYENSCSLSPNGKLFAYFATKYQGPKTHGVDYAWTAVSKLPWLAALALWPQSDTYTGRVSFADDRTLLMDCTKWQAQHPTIKPPTNFNVHSRWVGRGASEQVLPYVPTANATFDGQQGIDSLGRAFQYVDGRLERNGRVMVDLQAMEPDPQPPPEHAHKW